jgi:hypothetical protein
MNSKSFFLIAGTVFGIVAIAHLLRIVMSLPVTIGEWGVPIWASWAAVIVAGGLSFIGLRLARAAQKPQPSVKP